MKKSLYIILTALLICACSEKNDITMEVRHNTPSNDPFSPAGMVYTSLAELDSIYNADSENVIYFNTARLIASAELVGGAVQQYSLASNGHWWHLTRFPKVIYNYDNTPKYYEFGLVADGYLIGTVTTYAQKEIAGVIAYLLPLLDYSCDSLDYYVGMYPTRYYGTGGECYLKNCDEPLEGEYFENNSTDQLDREFMFAQMDQDDIDGMIADCDAEGSDIDLSEDIAERDAYWDQMEEFESEHPCIFEIDGAILSSISLAAFQAGTWNEDSCADSYLISLLVSILDYAIGYYDTHTLSEYSNPMLQVTHWSGFCGPAACAWVYRGKYTQYDNAYLPIYGDGTNNNNDYYYEDYIWQYAEYEYDDVDTYQGLYNVLGDYSVVSYIADNGLGYHFYSETVPFWWGGWQFPLYHGGLNRGFRAVTNDEYHVYFTCYPFDCILEKQEPVIIAINCNHYIVAFGYGATLNQNGDVKDKYFMVTDNGYTTSSTHYHPYMRRKNFWNLHYGLTR